MSVNIVENGELKCIAGGGDCESVESGTIRLGTEDEEVYVRYFGKCVNVLINDIAARRETAGWHIMFIIPEEYRPKSMVYGMVYDNGVASNEKNLPLDVSVNPDGTVSVYLFADKLNVPSVHGSISYII